MGLKGKVSAGKREAEHRFWEVQLKGALLSVAVAVLVLGLAALLIAGAVIPEGCMDGCVLVAALSGVIAGVMAVRAAGKKGGAVYGMLCAAVLVSACMMSGILLYGQVDWMWCAVVGAVCVAGGGITGAVGGQKRYRRR